jgi:hypothetical protein
MDFFNDLRGAIEFNLNRWRVNYNKMAPIEDLLLDYLTMIKKMVSARPRIVKFSPDLTAKLSTHSKRNEILLIQQLFAAGKNVNPYQSKRLLQTNFHDHLVYEWEIYHFHLSDSTQKNSSFVKQVNQLLFVHVSHHEAIFLDAVNHAPGIFGDTRGIEILHDHFPNVIDRYVDTRESEHFLIPDVNALERQRLWDKGYNIPMTSIRGKMYVNPGLGRTTSGHNVRIVRHRDARLDWIDTITIFIDEHYSGICHWLQLDATSTNFRLRFGNKDLEIYDQTSGKILVAYPNILTFDERTAS